MTAPRSILLALALLAAGAGAAPAALVFDGEAYRAVAREDDPARIAEHFVREGESAERFSRRLTIADQPKAAGAKAVASGVVAFARLRTPGIAPETFAAEGAEERDVTVTWYALTDDDAAVEFHAARFVTLTDRRGRSKGVREYHLVAREYTNGRDPDAALAEFVPPVAALAGGWVEALQHLERAPKR